ncbi:MAG TPA: DnaA/Hda family protein, partial [Burkholderiaceae bacterium]|nr:DnaA/Hda family protein [Burkholderiaceae bacterium]
MRQIPLDLKAAEPPSFDNFVPGSNGEVLALLRELARPPQPGQTVRAAYLWGEPGCGRTHLLAALTAACGERALRLGPGSEP